MERQFVYKAIDSERAYQQTQGLPDERTMREWLKSVDYYLAKAERGLFAFTNESCRANIRKIAALAVAALEQYGCEPREGYATPAPPQVDEGKPLPCPFCGSKGIVSKQPDWGVSCEYEIAGCCHLSHYHATREEAVAEWNRRAPQASGDGALPRPDAGAQEA